jgi:beta-aspartyl-peptidase (threonine type)
MPPSNPAENSAQAPRPFGLVIHGGAGRRDPLLLPRGEDAHRAQLGAALDAGYSLLDDGASAIDAVVAAVRALEDCGLFDAGRGSVFNAEGFCELDAALMDGRTLQAGAVAGIRHVRSPISLARGVMEKSPHVMLIGDGAEAFARDLGCEMVANGYFQSEQRRLQWERAKKRQGGPAAEEAHGTVGCAALDRAGNLAAGTSTGGILNKKWGRVGDSPIIGAGTYADNLTCAVSATGAGEFFIREVVGHDISAQMRYKGSSLDEAVGETLAKVGRRGGLGGVASIDRDGHVVLRFNTPLMYRGFRLSTGARGVDV